MLPPTPSGSIDSPLTWKSYPVAVTGEFEAPRLIIPVDRANPSKMSGTGYNAQLSPAISSILQYEIKPSAAGKTCSLVFYMPPVFQYPEMSPAKLRSPGGINISRVSSPINGDVRAMDIGTASAVGTIPALEPGHLYNIASGPCEAGQRINYQFDSIGGLDITWFQLTSPPIGPFLQIT